MTNRREFIKSSGRSILLALIGFGAVWGFRQKKLTTKARAACSTGPGCQGCGKLAGCRTEQAKEYRGEGKREKEAGKKE